MNIPQGSPPPIKFAATVTVTGNGQIVVPQRARDRVVVMEPTWDHTSEPPVPGKA